MLKHMPLPLYHSASTEPPSYAALSTEFLDEKGVRSSRGVIGDGAGLRWQIPLLTCRALSMGPALWWGIRCVYTLSRELLWGEVFPTQAPALDAEKRFRITEVFLSILWVGSKGRRLRKTN